MSDFKELENVLLGIREFRKDGDLWSKTKLGFEFDDYMALYEKYDLLGNFLSYCQQGEMVSHVERNGKEVKSGNLVSMFFSFHHLYNAISFLDKCLQSKRNDFLSMFNLYRRYVFENKKVILDELEERGEEDLLNKVNKMLSAPMDPIHNFICPSNNGPSHNEFFVRFKELTYRSMEEVGKCDVFPKIVKMLNCLINDPDIFLFFDEKLSFFHTMLMFMEWIQKDRNKWKIKLKPLGLFHFNSYQGIGGCKGHGTLVGIPSLFFPRSENEEESVCYFFLRSYTIAKKYLKFNRSFKIPALKLKPHFKKFSGMFEKMKMDEAGFRKRSVLFNHLTNTLKILSEKKFMCSYEKEKIPKDKSTDLAFRFFHENSQEISKFIREMVLELVLEGVENSEIEIEGVIDESNLRSRIPDLKVVLYQEFYLDAVVGVKKKKKHKKKCMRAGVGLFQKLFMFDGMLDFDGLISRLECIMETFIQCKKNFL